MNGLIRKISDSDFIEYITSHDIVVLLEACLSPKTHYNLDITGYRSYHLHVNKSPLSRKGRYSGGIRVYYKNSLHDKVQICKEHQCGIIWLKFCKSLFSFENDVFICNVYIPPHDSRVFANNDVDMFDLIESDIENYKSKGKVFITGDFNARTSNEIDYITG